MRPFSVPSRKSGKEVEFDRCGDCGGVWFDAGELAEASGRAVTVKTARTDRQCPACELPLMRGMLSGDVEVETCTHCRGTFLEARDMDALVKRVPKQQVPGGTGFVCDGCGERKPFSHAQPTLTGLECAACVEAKKVPAATVVEAKRPSVFGGFIGWLRWE